MKEIKLSEIRLAIDKSLANGWAMTKKISAGGVFSSSVYDQRVVYNRTDIAELLKQGFFLNQDAGVIVLNVLLEL